MLVQRLPRIALTLALFACGLPLAKAAEPIPVRVHEIENQGAYNKRYSYFLVLLEHVLNASCEECVVKKVAFPLATSTRNTVHLQKGRIDVAWLNTNSAREKQLRPIRIPIYKGLIGWRRLLAREGTANKLKDVTSLEQLQTFWAGQGHDWPDTPILKSAGLQVRTSDTWEGIIHLLRQERIDYFPRGLNEIFYEAQTLRHHGIVIEHSLALHYPAAVYFYVAKHNQALAQRLEAGFETIIKNGVFDRLFHHFFDADIRAAHLETKRIFELSNPDLPPLTPLSRAELWFTPASVVGSNVVGSNVVGSNAVTLKAGASKVVASGTQNKTVPEAAPAGPANAPPENAAPPEPQ
ncbi:transporter substrate-binding domain-containing protein [Teredinibacter turnerae]|uniref:transporter substrate-binding domain-containing protein n=1 Tax=Teredinibacter turnerae TaxID=2426 RepID=UPI0005F82948|nr:transporter substrate-binding domain-containing protein [Teredinibacter turnerae]